MLLFRQPKHLENQMKKTVLSLIISSLLASSAMAEKPNYDISDKPPEFKPLTDEFGITVKKAEPQDDAQITKEEKAAEEETAKTEERKWWQFW